VAADDRFEELYGLYSFQYFDLEYLRNHAGDKDILETFTQEIPVLIQKLNLNEFSAQIHDGFPYLIDYFKESVSKDDDIVSIYRELLLDYGFQFPILMNLITIYQILPLTNVECERTFSEQNRTKTKLRSIIEKELLSALLQISMNSREKNPNLIKGSIIRWKEKRSRYFFNNQIPDDE